MKKILKVENRAKKLFTSEGPAYAFWKNDDRGLKDSSFEGKFVTDDDYIHIKVIQGHSMTHTTSWQAKIDREKKRKIYNFFCYSNGGLFYKFHS